MVIEPEEDVQTPRVFDLKDFTLSPDMFEKWRACEVQFKSTIGNWNSLTSYEKDPYAHLYAIRAMSIKKIITQVKINRSVSANSLSDLERMAEEEEAAQNPPEHKSYSMESVHLTADKVSFLKKFQDAEDWDQ